MSREPMRSILLGLAGLLLAFSAACGGKGSGGSGGATQYYSNYHKAGWINEHPGQAMADLSACTKCHEFSVLKVGSGVPSCMTSDCHHKATANFGTAPIHGPRAKMAPDPLTGGSLAACQLCHGKDFSGGAATATSACSTCHGVKAPHPPKPWRVAGSSTLTHGTTDPANAPVCAQCHYAGSPSNPANHPAVPAPAGTQPGCYNGTLCHANPTPHPVPFLAGSTDDKGNGHLNATAATFAADCSSCHAHTGTSPSASAPLCSVCHKLADPVASGTGAGTCLSCHTGPAGLPKGPAGGSFPSLAGAHAKHMGLATALTCNTCHLGSSAGTAAHYANANYRTGNPAAPASVAMDATFTAKSGGSPAFSPTALTCSNVSCHGGQTAPNWLTGAIASATQCTACHGVASGTAPGAQHNDAFGRHSLGTHNALIASNQVACTTCHNMANGSPGALAHFKYLNTPAVDGISGTPADQLPSGTIVFDPAIVSGSRTYLTNQAGTAEGNGGCALTCHTHTHTTSISTWLAAAPSHPIPFKKGDKDTLGNGHFTVTAATFAADCATCHAHAGPSPTPSAPLCNTCHLLADPAQAATGAGTCLSCHAGASGLPLGPNGGTTFPSIAGAHAKHMGLPTALTCDTCHAGSGAGTDTHYLNANYRTGVPAGPAPVAIAATFQAKTGGAPAFSPNALTCSNVSCHGGQTTPSWQVGTLNSATQCTACHGVATSPASATQFNDAFGRHSEGTHDATNGANGIACTTCHNMANGSQGALAHFKYLNTAAVDGTSGTPADQLPSGTIVFDPAIVSGPLTYSVNSATQGNGSCALTCHSHIHTAQYDTWQANGAIHPVPFYAGQVDGQNNAHMTVTAAVFAADCGTCHSISGTSPMANAPNCATCHKLADPTTPATGAGTCLSCHVGASFATAGPAGSTFPSAAGAHPKHLSLPTALTCDSCHAGSGTGTSIHYDSANYRTGTPAAPASVAIASAFTAQHGGSPAFTPSAFTCSNVSCHGGQTTPDWRAAGSIVSTTDCRKCHAINDGSGSTPTQYNDAVGRHAWGTHAAAGTSDCTVCHDMSSANTANGAVKHFAELDTISVSSSNKYPSGTIRFNTLNTAYQISGNTTYLIDGTHPETDGGCALTCHSVSPSATLTHEPIVYHWQAAKGSGVAHAVPFISTGTSTAGNRHHQVTAATFASDCASCHDIQAPSSKAGPTCMTCHTLADPTQASTGAGTCLSCHVGANFATLGPQGATNTWPNLPGAHAKHVSLLTFTRTTPFAPTVASAFPACSACHVGSVPYDSTQTHYTNANKRTNVVTSGPAPVAMDAKFNAQSGAATPNVSPSNFTCSNVSCHGGQTTPGWQSGTLTVNGSTYCTACHKVASTATQYNDATGRHNNPTQHANDGNFGGVVTCDHCHDMNVATNNRTGVVNHFKYLDTTAVRVSPDQLSSDTIKFGGGASPATGSLTYTVNATIGRGGCALTCHGQSHTTTGNVWN